MTRRAYTIVELLVVVVIGALLVSLAVPAFSSILTSSRLGMAQNALQQAIYAARDAAARNVGGGDAAAVFFYDPNRGLSVGVYEQVGTFADASASPDPVNRDLFVPIPTMEPSQLPPGFSVRGFALATAFNDDWYEDLVEYTNQTPRDAGPGTWLFPETEFYNKSQQDDGEFRQSFMVRFDAGTGALSRDQREALVLDPRPSSLNRPGTFSPINEAEDLRAWAVRALTTRSITDTERADLIGDLSSDTVLVRPVTDLTLYREKRLAQAMQLRRLNRDTGTVYEDRDEPRLDAAIFRNAADAEAVTFAVRVAQWVEGRMALRDNEQGTAQESETLVYTVNAYFGDLVEIER